MKIRPISRFFKYTRKRLFSIVGMVVSSCSPAGAATVNAKEIRFVGLQRSGNHAIINWIFQQAPEPRCHLNCVEPGSNPFHTFQRKSSVEEFQKDFFEKFNIYAEMCGLFSRKSLLIYSYEDEDLRDVSSEPFERRHDRWLGRSASRFDIVLVRDPYNLFASRLKREESGIPNRYSLRVDSERGILCGLWKQYAREFLGETGFLPHNRLAVNYNRWFLEKEYRMKLSAALGLEFSDGGMDEVLHVGGGSSFDRMSFDNKASEMKVLERWRNYEKNELFRSIFRDRELVGLSERIFGADPAVKEFTDKL